MKDSIDPPLLISEINLEGGSKDLDLATLKINKQKTKIPLGQGVVWREKFDPPIAFSANDACVLSLRKKRSTWKILKTNDADISIHYKDISRVVSDGKREYVKSENGVKIIIGFSPNSAVQSSDDLKPTTEDILENCPRMRILVIGKSGVGKSSLIKEAFGVQDVKTSDYGAGQATIGREFESNQNGRFVLHDSQGFEPGETKNWETVKTFIQERDKQPELKDKLHAIWLCIAIPTSGGRVLETATEELLHLKSEGKLGKVPIIAAFTKYDTFLAHTRKSILDNPALKGQDANVLAKSELEKLCAEPIRKILQSNGPTGDAFQSGRDVPWVAVTTNKRPEYRGMLSQLITLTRAHVGEHVGGDASTVTAMAQRVDPQDKINETIKKRYWRSLAASPNFPGHTLEKCLHVIHDDIVAVWNFEDPSCLLSSKQFRQSMMDMADDLDVRDAPDPNNAFAAASAVVGPIASILTSLSGPAALIVLPVALGAVALVNWAHDTYERSHVVLQRFMAYIVDVTLVLQNLFLLVSERHEPASNLLIEVAIAAYKDSPMKTLSRAEIQKYDRDANLKTRMDGDSALETVAKLVKKYSITAVEVAELSKEIPHIDAVTTG
ncbi:hypothetical protein HYDPIDRAFT_115381 [Hydnomerulius pinastri MD-312]|uniref:G domain-containing protein n=1 Tax=Hydnomerulius pinastri MD-312 TaxID=994086 RepID=A0A0C9W5D5_9AGAM|nr:hypothetical protein HYDPIDRAFT_115381 [Hydnomerulius pinastri MD-312]